MKKSAKGVVYTTYYIDDNLMVGNPEATDEAIGTLQDSGFLLKAMEGLQDYMS